MTGLAFSVLGAEPVAFALQPTLRFPLRVEAPGERVQSIVLRCQLRVEPQQRRYEPREQRRLRDVFGDPHRWAETAKPFLWTHVTTSIGPFDEATDTALDVECSYDLEVSAGKYFHALDDGEVPLLFLFSGTVFTRGPQGLAAQQVPWDREARLRMPVGVWRELMDAYYPGGGWLRLRRETLDGLLAYKSQHALPTFDDTVSALLAEQSRLWGPLDGLEARA